MSTERATFASSIPLGVMALAFFLPAAQDCNGAIVSPADEAMKSVGSFVWLTPTYLGAAMLAFAIGHALTTRRTSSLVPAIAIATNLAASMFMLLAETKTWVGQVPALLSIPLLVLARRRSGVERLSFLIDAFVFLAIPTVALNVEVGAYWGAYVFIVSYVALVTLRASHAWSMLRASRPA